MFALCEVENDGRVRMRRELKRDGFHAWLAAQPAGTVVAMEACSSAHYWGRACGGKGVGVILVLECPSLCAPSFREINPGNPCGRWTIKN